MNSKAKHFWNSLEDGEIINWRLVKILEGNDKCCCGTNIKYIYFIENIEDKRIKKIGSSCANRLGIKLSWKNIPDYLGNAYLMARNEKEKAFVRGFQDKLPAYGNLLKVSTRQKKWVEDITKKKWKWGIWLDTSKLPDQKKRWLYEFV
jgi:hypothetical protein